MVVSFYIFNKCYLPLAKRLCFNVRWMYVVVYVYIFVFSVWNVDVMLYSLNKFVKFKTKNISASWRHIVDA